MFFFKLSLKVSISLYKIFHFEFLLFAMCLLEICVTFRDVIYAFLYLNASKLLHLKFMYYNDLLFRNKLHKYGIKLQFGDLLFPTFQRVLFHTHLAGYYRRLYLKLITVRNLDLILFLIPGEDLYGECGSCKRTMQGDRQSGDSY